MSNFLEQHYDPAIEPPRVESREQLEIRQIERIQRALAITLLAGTIPRRLGGDASDEDLALDKRRARRVAHALSQSRKGWTKRDSALPLDEEIRRNAAQIVWTRWMPVHLTAIRQERILLATWAVRNNDRQWGKKVVVRLNNELKWVEQALRD